MTYEDVHEQIEGILIGMVEAGEATFAHVGPHGSVFEANADLLWDHMTRAGLLSDTVPWPLTVVALARLRTGPEEVPA